jgi:hypothetical protein
VRCFLNNIIGRPVGPTTKTTRRVDQVRDLAVRVAAAGISPEILRAAAETLVTVMERLDLVAELRKFGNVSARARPGTDGPVATNTDDDA